MSEAVKLLLQALGREAARLAYEHLIKGRNPKDITLADLIDEALTDTQRRRLERSIYFERIRIARLEARKK